MRTRLSSFVLGVLLAGTIVVCIGATLQNGNELPLEEGATMLFTVQLGPEQANCIAVVAEIRGDWVKISPILSSVETNCFVTRSGGASYRGPLNILGTSSLQARNQQGTMTSTRWINLNQVLTFVSRAPEEG